MSWKAIIKNVIETIEFAPYSQKGGQNGVTEDIYWQDTRIMKAGNPPRSHCVGAVGEVLLKAFKEFDLENIIPVSDIEYFKEHGFIYDLETQYDGYPGALVELGWGEWIDKEDAEYGDVAQYWHEDDNGDLKSGHAVIITGQSKYKGKDVFTNWSSTNLAKKPHGHQYDWHLLDRELRTGHKRIWYITRPDIEQIKSNY